MQKKFLLLLTVAFSSPGSYFHTEKNLVESVFETIEPIINEIESRGVALKTNGTNLPAPHNVISTDTTHPIVNKACIVKYSSQNAYYGVIKMQGTALANPSSTPSGEIGSSLSSIPLSLHSKYIIWQIGQDPIKYLTNQYEGFSINANGAVDTQSDVVAVSPPLAIIGANIPRLISANIKYVKMGPDSEYSDIIALI